MTPKLTPLHLPASVVAELYNYRDSIILKPDNFAYVCYSIIKAHLMTIHNTEWRHPALKEVYDFVRSQPNHPRGELNKEDRGEIVTKWLTTHPITINNAT